jgi:hypothetical protein
MEITFELDEELVEMLDKSITDFELDATREDILRLAVKFYLGRMGYLVPEDEYLLHELMKKEPEEKKKELNDSFSG